MKSEFAIVTPKSIKIGDDSYFEEYAQDPKRLSELTYSQKIPSDFIGHIVIEETTEKIGDLDTHWNDFIVVFAKDVLLKLDVEENQEEEYCPLVSIYKNGYALEDGKKKLFELGCDTASFSIYLDRNICHFNTLSDGLYGTVTEHYENDKLTGIVFEGWLDSAAMDHDELVNVFKNLFEVKE